MYRAGMAWNPGEFAGLFPRGKKVFIKLAFAYEATTQYSRTDRKPRSAHVTVLSALDSALAATAPPAPPPPPPLPGGGCAPRGALVSLVPFQDKQRSVIL
jgi:hypothetical protein